MSALDRFVTTMSYPIGLENNSSIHVVVVDAESRKWSAWADFVSDDAALSGSNIQGRVVGPAGHRVFMETLPAIDMTPVEIGSLVCAAELYAYQNQQSPEH